MDGSSRAPMNTLPPLVTKLYLHFWISAAGSSYLTATAFSWNPSAEQSDINNIPKKCFMAVIMILFSSASVNTIHQQPGSCRGPSWTSLKSILKCKLQLLMAIDLFPLLGWQPNFVVVSSVCKVKGDVNADFWHGSLLNLTRLSRPDV